MAELYLQKYVDVIMVQKIGNLRVKFFKYSISEKSSYSYQESIKTQAYSARKMHHHFSASTSQHKNIVERDGTNLCCV